jgi:flagellar hook-associated protein 3 FlgL
MFGIGSLSTLQANILSRNTVSNTRGEVEKASVEIASGFKNDVAADLGLRSSETLALRASMSKTEEFILQGKLLESKMGYMSDVMTQIITYGQNLMNIAVGNKESLTPTATVMNTEAMAALNNITSMLNSSFNGEYIFAGTSTTKAPVTGYEKVSPLSGQSPKSVMDGILGGGISNSLDAATKINEIDAIFSGTNSVDPSRNFESTFYSGTPALNASGMPNPRVTAKISDSADLPYGVQANDAAMKSLLKGITMIAAMDPTKITDQDAYRAWMSEAVSSMNEGIAGVTTSLTDMGRQRSFLDDVGESHLSRKDIFNSRILNLEQVDPYEAATRLSALQTQLEATYSTTAKLAKMTILNYL